MKENTKENTKEKIKEPFFIVPSKVFELGLNPYELSVLFYLMMRADNEMHSCFPSAKVMAGGCKISERKVRDVIHSLEEKKIIEVKSKFVATKNDFNRQTANNYSIRIFKTPPAPSASRVCTTYTPSMHDVHLPPALHAGEINKTISNITKSNITKSTELSLDLAVELKKRDFRFVNLNGLVLKLWKTRRDLTGNIVLCLTERLSIFGLKVMPNTRAENTIRASFVRCLIIN